ncbi:ABC transporter ATP-binding protein [Bdellovibrio bacteriovorus]|uniref:ABC transporter ATP-binding protein n=1 Tax=Bdellovibrio bacteriovorus TaxID=959 RepID=A0A150WJK8_BDEBC|nr:ABC transporter ATP-binding protein [Bdellovibrio bacteriovorus]KYG63874.1 ABC transporter ATP-binding protein [Bdellovibrio bacteriovorus]
MLKVENLAIHYGGIQAVRGISFEVKAGELVSLIGSNGAGKTSTLRAISGLVNPSSGNVYIDGKVVTDMPANKRVSLGLAHCPEARKIFSQQSVLDNLTLGAYLRFGKEKKSDIETSIEEMFAIFPKLKERQKQVAGTLSGGEQQMLAIGRALMLKPKILMLDEPSMGLAPVIIEEVFRVIERIKSARTTTILLVEQLAFMALKVADRGIVLEQGVIRLEGPAADLKDNPIVREAYLGVKTS